MSCYGNDACSNLKYSHIGLGSCQGVGACIQTKKGGITDEVGMNWYWKIGVGSCNGKNACADTAATFKVGTNSCNGDNACHKCQAHVPSIHVASIGDNQCNRVNGSTDFNEDGDCKYCDPHLFLQDEEQNDDIVSVANDDPAYEREDDDSLNDDASRPSTSPTKKKIKQRKAKASF